MNENPYATPSSHVDDPAGTPAEINLFNAQGRIGRMRFVTYNFSLVIIAYLFLILALLLVGADIFQGSRSSANMGVFGAIMFIFIVAYLVFNIFFTVKRLHDVNLSGWVYLVTLIPVINVLIALYLLFAPGTEGQNNFGNPPIANSLGVKIIFGFVVVLFVLGLIGGIIGAILENQ